MSGKAMSFGSRRDLSLKEREALSEGLAAALHAAGGASIVARPSVPALITALWRRTPPVMVLGQTIYWPGATEDFSGDPERMAVLQHELQHVLDFAAGALTRLGYLFRPRNWIYSYAAGKDWKSYGAEQRAMIAQHYWMAERGLLPGAPPLSWFQKVLPWV